MKLTNEIRNSIVVKAMAGYKSAEKAKIEERRIAFGTEMYEHTYGKDEATVFTLAKFWYDMDDEIVISCEGFEQKRRNYDKSDPDDLNSVIPLGRNRPFPNTLSCSDVTLAPAKEDRNGKHMPAHPLYAKAQKLVKDHRVIVKQETELREKIQALLRSCNTDKQLLQAWPEAEQFLPKTFEHSTALVPVGMSDAINAALGIPSKASVATAATRKAASIK